MAGVLREGLEALDLGQSVSFQAYTRVVIPIDKYVYWSPRAKFNFKGALHFSQEIVQNEDETFGAATVVFTSEDQITEFTTAPTSTIYVATAEDGFRYAFSQIQGYFKQAGLWHYWGRSVSPAMAANLLDRNWKIDPEQATVSNSLPLWLGLNGFASDYYGGFSDQGVPFKVKAPILYPSFIVSPNEIPPYGSVHIDEAYPQALQATPFLDVERNHWQLVTDKVRITLYGLQNDACLDFIDTVNQYSLVTDNFGIMNMPVIRDAIRTQPELEARAMKKVVEFDISYYQRRVAQIARQLIKHAPYGFAINDDATQ
jgi:hypothetical protein